MNWIAVLPIVVALVTGAFTFKDWMRNGSIRRQLKADVEVLDKLKELGDMPGRQRLQLHVDRTAQQLVALEEPWRRSEERMRAFGAGLVVFGVITGVPLFGYAVMYPTLWTDLLGRLPAGVGLVGVLLLHLAKRLRSARQEAAFQAITGEPAPSGRSGLLLDQLAARAASRFGEEAVSPNKLVKAAFEVEVAPPGTK